MPRAHVQPLHRVTIGRSRELRGPDALERGFAGVIITLALLLAGWGGAQAMRMSETLEAVSLASGPENDLIVYHAEHGQWPAPGQAGVIGNNINGLHVRTLSLAEDGVLTAALALGRVRYQRDAGIANPIHADLSFRPELLGAADAPTIVFLCGDAAPVAGAATTPGKNRTTLAPKYLPPFCR